MRNAVDSASASVAVPPYQPISLPKPSPSLSVLPFPSIYTVLNTAARLIARLPRYSHISYNIKEHLHWLPISTRIEYKVLLIVLKAQMGVAPKYLRDAIRLPTSATSLRPLR